MAAKKTIQKSNSPAKSQTKKFDKTFWIMSAIVFAVSFIFYAKSLSNEYALDDGITMEKNEYVHQGFSGISSIMTKDAYASFFQQLGSKGQLSGGRYRPLSIVTFAIEYEIFGLHPGDQITITGSDGKDYKGKLKKITPGGEVTYTTKEYGDGMANLTAIHEFKKLAHTQHFFNVLLFAISMVILFLFLYQVLFTRLQHKEYWALFVTLVFAMHPIHSEVVANIKSRDEILSLLFVLLTLIQFDQFFKNKNWKNGLLMGVFFFLAMLSKEYGAVLLLIVPVWAFIAQKKWDTVQLIWAVIPLVAAFLPYYFLRVGAVMVGDPQDVKPDVLNDYFMYAKGDETKATQIYILLKYFLLQLYPFPLASDYSFKTIAFRHFSSPEVMVSIVLHLTMVVGVVYAIFKKHLILAFAGMYYLFNLMLINNLIFNIGASMGERLVYNSSLGLIIVVFYALYYFTKGLSGKASIYIGGGLVVCMALPSFMVVSSRCAAWKNDYTLATTDVKTNPNSALLNANAGTYTVNRSELFVNKGKEKEMVLEARGYVKKALEVHPLMANGWMNLSVIEHKLNNFEASELAVKKVIEIFPSHPKVPVLLNMVSNDYINVGFEKYKEGNVDSCFIYLYRAKNVAPNNPEAYYNLGGAYLSVARNLDSAEFYFTKTVQMNPQHQQANQGLASVKQARGQ